jgi:hypothetical protein
MQSKLLLALGLATALAACGPPNPVQDPTNPPEIAPSDTKPTGTGMDPVTNSPPGTPPSPDATPTTPTPMPPAPTGPASGTGTQ